MGAADIVPGVSGGTIAFITGIYERLLAIFPKLNRQTLILLTSGQWKTLWHFLDLQFFILLFSGIAISFLSLSRLVLYAYQNYPNYLLSFFIGLILASVWLLFGKIKSWTWHSCIGLILGMALGIGLVFLKPTQENASFIYVFFCGLLAICSMLLPGISGSFVLLLLGNYFLLLRSLYSLEWQIIISFALGALVGVIAFGRLLQWLFKHYAQTMIAFLLGVVLSSVALLWPWREETKITTFINGKLKEKVIGYEYTYPEITHEIFWALGFVLLGFIIVFLLERYGRKLSNN